MQIAMMTDRRPDLTGLRPLDLSMIESTSSLSLEQRVERATRILDVAVSPTFMPQGSSRTPTQSSPLRQVVKRALKVADEAASSRDELTPVEPERPSWPTVPDITKERTTSGSLDLRDPHWVEMRQQQMLYNARVPPCYDLFPFLLIYFLFCLSLSCLFLLTPSC